MGKIIFVIGALIAAIQLAVGCSVSNQVSYTTLDASVLTNIAYITEFDLSCAKGQNVYAQVQGGQLMQLARNNNGAIILSWTTDVAMATKGDHVINVYDEEGYSQLKKGSSGVSVATLTINHPGAYNGPWLNSEHLAAILGIFVGYLAVSSKSNLLA